MRLALNMAKMAKGVFSHAAIDATHYLIEKPWAKVREVKKRGDELPGHRNVMAAMDRLQAMLWENPKDGCLPRQTGTAYNPQTR